MSEEHLVECPSCTTQQLALDVVTPMRCEGCGKMVLPICLEEPPQESRQKTRSPGAASPPSARQDQSPWGQDAVRDSPQVAPVDSRKLYGPRQPAAAAPPPASASDPPPAQPPAADAEEGESASISAPEDSDVLTVGRDLLVPVDSLAAQTGAEEPVTHQALHIQVTERPAALSSVSRQQRVYRIVGVSIAATIGLALLGVVVLVLVFFGT